MNRISLVSFSIFRFNSQKTQVNSFMSHVIDIASFFHAFRSRTQHPDTVTSSLCCRTFLFWVFVYEMSLPLTVIKPQIDLSPKTPILFGFSIVYKSSISIVPVCKNCSMLVFCACSLLTKHMWKVDCKKLLKRTNQDPL